MGDKFTFFTRLGEPNPIYTYIANGKIGGIKNSLLEIRVMMFKYGETWSSGDMTLAERVVCNPRTGLDEQPEFGIRDCYELVMCNVQLNLQCSS